MRLSREQMFMGIARVVSMRSTCCRLSVGAVLVGPDHSLLSIGYNGSPPGLAHCGGSDCQWFTSDGCRVQHAEQNAIARGTRISGSHLYVTHSPCLSCASLIIEYQTISTVYYESEYRNIQPIDLLLGAGIRVYRLLPSGYIIDKLTGNMSEV